MDKNTKHDEHAKALPITQPSVLSNFASIWWRIKFIARIKNNLVVHWVDNNPLMGPSFDISYNNCWNILLLRLSSRLFC